MLPSVAVTVMEVVCAAAMVPVAGVKVNQLGEVEADAIERERRRREIRNGERLRLQRGSGSSEKQQTARRHKRRRSGARRNDVQNNRDGDGRMNAVGRRENHRAVIILRGESGWIRGDRQRGRDRAGNAVAAGRC